MASANKQLSTPGSDVNGEVRFCAYCRTKLDIGAKFCKACGKAVNGESNETQNQRKIVYEGEIHKCPNCGEVLKSLTLICPACGYELRGNRASNIVHEFATKLSDLADDNRKIMLIRSFPIPNSKEDIWEFIILASSNIGREIENELSDAWQAKFLQAYQKADMLFKDEIEFIKIQEIYANTSKIISKREQAKKVKKTENVFSELMPVIPNLIIIVGWLLSIFTIIPICGIKLDNVGFNAYQLLLWIIFIVGVFLIPQFTQSESSLPRLVTTLGLILSIVVLIPLRTKNLDSAGFSSYQLVFVIDIVCSIIIFVKMIKNRPSTSNKNGGISFVIALVITAVFFITFLITSLVASFNNHSDMNEGNSQSYDQEFEWPKTGLNTYLPQPSSTKGEIHSNCDKEFWADIEGYSESEFEKYIEECKNAGFTIDNKKTIMNFEAYNEDGYYLDLMHADYNNELSIRIHVPYATEKMKWPTQGLALLIPTPNAEHGEIDIDTHIQLSIYVGDTSKEKCEEYINSCIEKGFDVDYSRSDAVYDADDKKGNSLRIKYRGNNIMYISMYSYDAFDD